MSIVPFVSHAAKAIQTVTELMKTLVLWMDWILGCLNKYVYVRVTEFAAACFSKMHFLSFESQ